MKVELHVSPWKGSERVPMDEAWIAFTTGVVVDGEQIWAAGGSAFRIDEDGFLSIEFQRVAKETWDRFMKSRDSGDVLEGSGEQIVEGGKIVGIAWAEGCSLKLPVTEIVTIEVPEVVNAHQVGDRDLLDVLDAAARGEEAGS